MTAPDSTYARWILLRLLLLLVAAAGVIWATFPFSDSHGTTAIILTALAATATAVVDFWFRRHRRRDPRFADDYLLDFPVGSPSPATAFAVIAQAGQFLDMSAGSHVVLAFLGATTLILNFISGRLYVRRRQH